MQIDELIARLNAVSSGAGPVNPAAVAAHFSTEEWSQIVAEYRRRPDARWGDGALVAVSAWIATIVHVDTGKAR